MHTSEFPLEIPRTQKSQLFLYQNVSKYLSDEPQKKTLMRDLEEIKRNIKKYKVIYYILLVLNILLFVLSIYQFTLSNNKLVFDLFFISLFISNIIVFYVTYKIYDKYNFLKYQFEHFNNLKK